MALDTGMNPLHDPTSREEMVALMKQHVCRFAYFLETLAMGDPEEMGAQRRLAMTLASRETLRATWAHVLVAIDECHVEPNPVWAARRDPTLQALLLTAANMDRKVQTSAQRKRRKAK